MISYCEVSYALARSFKVHLRSINNPRLQLYINFMAETFYTQHGFQNINMGFHFSTCAIEKHIARIKYVKYLKTPT